MAEEDGLRLDALEPLQGVERLVARLVEPRRPDLRAASTGQHVVLEEDISGKEERAGLEVESDAPRAVPRGMDRARSPGHVDDLAVLVGLDLLDVEGVPAADESRHELPSRRVAEIRKEAGLALAPPTGASELFVSRVDMDGDPLLSAQLLGEPLVVGVAVSEHDRADVVEAPTELGESGLELRPVPGGAGVHEDHAVVIPHEVPVDERSAHAQDAVGYLGERLGHGGTLLTHVLGVQR